MGLSLIVPGFAWVSVWLYDFTRPIEEPLDIHDARRHLLIGALVGAVIAVFGLSVLNQHVGPHTW